MTDETYEIIYDYVSSCLYDPTYGLLIKYNANVENKEAREAKNIEVLNYMKQDKANEKLIVDGVINYGVEEARHWQYIVNEENLKRFINISTACTVAVRTYDKILEEEKAKEQNR